MGPAAFNVMISYSTLYLEGEAGSAGMLSTIGVYALILLLTSYIEDSYFYSKTAEAVPSVPFNGKLLCSITPSKSRFDYFELFPVGRCEFIGFVYSPEFRCPKLKF